MFVQSKVAIHIVVSLVSFINYIERLDTLLIGDWYHSAYGRPSKVIDSCHRHFKAHLFLGMKLASSNACSEKRQNFEDMVRSKIIYVHSPVVDFDIRSKHQSLKIYRTAV